MKTARHFLVILLCANLAVASAAAAQDPTATPLPVKATPIPAEVTPAPTAEATAEPTETPVTNLAYDTPVTGRITHDAPAQDWPLTLGSADRISLVVERLDGNLIPDIILLNAAAEQVGTSYGAQADGATALLDNVTLSGTGEFTVRVSRERGADGLTEGRYQLTLLPLAAAADSVLNTGIVGDIEIGEPVEGMITPEHWYHRYNYNAQAADQIRIISERTSGSLEPLVQVLGTDGSLIATGYTDTAGDTASADRVNLPAAGEYTIVVTRAQEFTGRTLGSYRLTVEMIGSGPGSPNLAGTAGAVTYNTALEGEISPLRWYEDWTLTAAAGDTLTIRVDRLDIADSSNLHPEVVLLGGSGQELARGYTSNTGDSAQIENRTLDGPGQYTVRVSRRSGQTGVTAGAYTLYVHLVGSGEGSPALQGTNGAVSSGVPVEGEVTNERWADSWSFAATAGERAVIRVERTGGTLIPRLQVRDLNRQVLANGYPDATRDTASISFTPPSTGEFLIVVMRDREQQGVTSGAYRLTISPE